MAMRIISCRPSVWGKSDAVCPSGPMPKATTSKPGISAPSRRKLCRISNSYFAAASSGIELAVDAKDLASRSGVLCRAAPLVSCGSCCPAGRAAHSVRRPNRAPACPRESARGRGRWDRPGAQRHMLRRVASGDCDSRLASCPSRRNKCLDQILRRAPAYRLRALVHVIENFMVFGHTIRVISISSPLRGLPYSLCQLRPSRASSSSPDSGPHVPLA